MIAGNDELLVNDIELAKSSVDVWWCPPAVCIVLCIPPALITRDPSGLLPLFNDDDELL
jgi:hypothetical protein